MLFEEILSQTGIRMEIKDIKMIGRLIKGEKEVNDPGKTNILMKYIM
jgi:hypothetical protein